MAVKKTEPIIGKTSQFKTVAAIIILFVVGALFIFLVNPARGEYLENKQSLTQKTTELNSLKGELVKLQTLEDQFVGGEVTQKDILNLIPETSAQDEIINSLADIAEDNEVSLNSMSFNTGESRELGINRMTITLNLSGTHNDLISFIEGLETASRKYSVKTINVQILENRLENMSITLEAYYL